MDEMATHGLGDVEERESADGSMLENPAAGGWRATGQSELVVVGQPWMVLDYHEEV